MLRETLSHMWTHYPGWDFTVKMERNMKIQRIESYNGWRRMYYLAKHLAEKQKKKTIISEILERIRKNVWSNCTIVKRPFKEARHKLTIERGIIFSADAIVLPRILRKDVIKSVHGDIHNGIAATQRRLRLKVWWPGYCKDVEEHIRCSKCTEIETFKQTKIYTWPKEGAPWTRVHMDHTHV